MLYNQWKYNRAKYSTADLEDGTAPITATSSSTCNAYVFQYVEGSAQCNATATSTSDSQKVRESGSLVMGDSVVSVVYVRKRNTTMISYAQSGSSSSCVRVVDASATSNVSSATSSSSERIRESDSTSAATSSITSNASTTYTTGAIITNTATTSCTSNRVKHFTVNLLGSSATFTIGREKWEVVSPTGTTWSTISETSQTWTKIAA